MGWNMTWPTLLRRSAFSLSGLLGERWEMWTRDRIGIKEEIRKGRRPEGEKKVGIERSSPSSSVQASGRAQVGGRPVILAPTLKERILDLPDSDCGISTQS